VNEKFEAFLNTNPTLSHLTVSFSMFGMATIDLKHACFILIKCILMTKLGMHVQEYGSLMLRYRIKGALRHL
jgi:hypothetical protein